jgi:hypothetical protein
MGQTGSVQRRLVCTLAQGATRQWRHGSHVKGTRERFVHTPASGPELDINGVRGGHATGGRMPVHGTYSARHTRQGYAAA